MFKIFKSPVKNNNLPTVVTALLNLDRGDLKGGFDRSFEHYLESFELLLKTELPMVVYMPEEYKNWLFERRNPENTQFIPFETNDLETFFPFGKEVNEIRNNQEWSTQAAWLRESPQVKLPLYNPLVMSKLLMLQDVAKLNPFNSTQMFWLDAGIANTVHPGYFYHDKVLENNAPLFNKFTFVCYPYTSNSEIHGFERKALAKVCDVDFVDRVARGGFFGGPVNQISEVCTSYLKLLESTLRNSFMGTEESIFTALTYLYPNQLNVYFIEENGLLSSFFEDLKTSSPKVDYVATLSKENSFEVTKADLDDWHSKCDMHFTNNLNIINSVFVQNQKLKVLDIGASTGKFFSRINDYFTIEKALLVEPFGLAAQYASELFKANNKVKVIQAAATEVDGETHLKLIKGDNNNLGIFYTIPFPEDQSEVIPAKSIYTLLKENDMMDVSFIKINTSGDNLDILKGVIPCLSQWDKLPFILFEYSMNGSKDELFKVLQQFKNAGYQLPDVYGYQGGGLMLVPSEEKLQPEVRIRKESSYKAQNTTHNGFSYMLKVVDYLQKSDPNINALIIGAMDGQEFDNLSALYTSENWNVLFVEPVPKMFEKLKSNFTNIKNKKFEQSAVASKDGMVEMVVTDMNIIENDEFHPAYKGMSSMLPLRNGLSNLIEQEAVQQISSKTQVNGITINSLLKKHQIKHLDIVQIDIEGHEWMAVSQFDLETLKPGVFVIEHIAVPGEELDLLCKHFVNHGYGIYWEDADLVAIENNLFNAAIIPTEVKQIVRANSNKAISTYIIAYNQPKQLELLMESFEKAGQFLLNNTQLFVLNNSDDDSVFEAYETIFAKYNMVEIRNGNMGICGGRQFIAEHFALSDARHMFFFEDDMLLHIPGSGPCRNGLCTYVPDLFEKSIKILESGNFDFIKLSFTEFFGDNKTQWAWYNVPQTVREKHFPAHTKLPENGLAENAPKTKFESIETLEGLSYLTGEIYYCNWPQLLGKTGNQKMFLDTTWQFPYEQTWMSHFFQLTLEKKLKPALLLASPINHNRAYHYSASQRKENNPEIKVEIAN